jgi:hypothetical protein
VKTFNDSKGRTWSLALNLGTVKAVKDALAIDLLQPEQGDPPLITRLGTDELLLAQVIWDFLRPQFEAQKIDEAEVAASFDGSALLAAQNAFWEELADFFHARGREHRVKAIRKQMALVDAGITAIGEKIDRVDVEATIRGILSGESPAPSPSTPAA